jgi:hypothetical protein
VKRVINIHENPVGKHGKKDKNEECELLRTIEADIQCGINENMPCNTCRNDMLDAMIEYVRVWRPEMLSNEFYLARQYKAKNKVKK